MPCRSGSCDPPSLYEPPKPRFFGTETVCASSGVCKPKAYMTFAKYWPFLDDLHTTWTAKSCAKKILRRQQWKARRRMGNDYKAGFTQAFIDIAHGGNGEIPAVPPPRFWNTQFRSPWGQQKAERWFDGYRAGAAMGSVELNAMRQIAASADWTIQKLKSPFSGQSCAPGSCPLGNCATGNCDAGLNGGSLLNPQPALPFRSSVGPGPGCVGSAGGSQTCPQPGRAYGPQLGPMLNGPPQFNGRPQNGPPPGFVPQFRGGSPVGRNGPTQFAPRSNGSGHSMNQPDPMQNAPQGRVPLNLPVPRNTQPGPVSGNLGPGHSTTGQRSGASSNRPGLQPGHSAPQIPGATPRDGIVY